MIFQLSSTMKVQKLDGVFKLGDGFSWIRSKVVGALYSNITHYICIVQMYKLRCVERFRRRFGTIADWIVFFRRIPDIRGKVNDLPLDFFCVGGIVNDCLELIPSVVFN